MKEIVLITGGSGTIAKKLSETLKSDFEVRFLTRKKKNPNDFEWDLNAKTIDEAALENVSHIIHLAGANIAEKNGPMNEKKKLSRAE